MGAVPCRRRSSGCVTPCSEVNPPPMVGTEGWPGGRGRKVRDHLASRDSPPLSTSVAGPRPVPQTRRAVRRGNCSEHDQVSEMGARQARDSLQSWVATTPGRRLWFEQALAADGRQPLRIDAGSLSRWLIGWVGRRGCAMAEPSQAAGRELVGGVSSTGRRGRVSLPPHARVRRRDRGGRRRHDRADQVRANACWSSTACRAKASSCRSAAS